MYVASEMDRLFVQEISAQRYTAFNGKGYSELKPQNPEKYSTGNIHPKGCGYKSGLQTLRSFDDEVAALRDAGSWPENFSVRTASLERYSSTPMYAPHMRRLPVKAERPCKIRWLFTTAW